MLWEVIENDCHTLKQTYMKTQRAPNPTTDEYSSQWTDVEIAKRADYSGHLGTYTGNGIPIFAQHTSNTQHNLTKHTRSLHLHSFLAHIMNIPHHLCSTPPYSVPYDELDLHLHSYEAASLWFTGDGAREKRDAAAGGNLRAF